ncbi:hypothetical protein [Desulfosediminicola flagellatus]|uniref:hypothetical protein n=1 Tax=Desulfosediminicola flagellatus TaxID=2569541 RepID=UPI0010AC87E9|nr:hypothetical protein [Desulfosediminicola flagellatus]
MKKIIAVIAGISLCATYAISVNAASLSQDATTGDVTIEVTAGNPTFDAFKPSTNVIVSGATTANSFAVGAYHEQVLAKKSGKAFGMASDANEVYYLDISAAGTAAPTVTGTNAATAFGDYTAM